MTSELDKAIAKLTEEAGNKRISQQIARHTIDIMRQRKTIGAVLDENKKLTELQKKFDECANRNKEGNRSFITPEEAEEMICKYYNLSAGAKRDSDRIDILDLL